MALLFLGLFDFGSMQGFILSFSCLNLNYYLEKLGFGKTLYKAQIFFFGHAVTQKITGFVLCLIGGQTWSDKWY